jgi:hypothetical protein
LGSLGLLIIVNGSTPDGAVIDNGLTRSKLLDHYAEFNRGRGRENLSVDSFSY